MCSLPGLHHSDIPQSIEMVELHRAICEAVKPIAAKPRRAKTWDLPSSYHCSIIGTCLSAAELRQLLVKLEEPNARTASDHTLHLRGVKIAAEKDVAAKLLNKTLNRKHDACIREASRLSTSAELRQYWRNALECGDVPGAYWAVLAHPAAGIDLLMDMFGEVHMLSHFLGSAGRADVARMKELESEVIAKSELLIRQEKRLETAIVEQANLRERLAEMDAQLIRERACRPAPAVVGIGGRADGLRDADKDNRIAMLESKLSEARENAEAARARAESSEKIAEALQRENDLIESVLSAEPREKDAGVYASANGRVLYVGGRRRLYDRLRALAAERGVTLSLHDGGLEDSTTLLPAAVAQADTVIFPVDHISHSASGLIKKLCRDLGKPFVPLRAAGLASFVSAISIAAE